MKLNEELEKKFNDQITLEMEASTVYRQLAIEMDAQDLPGMANWLRRQADEELVHANKFIDHLLNRDNHPKIGDVPAPEVPEELTPLAAFEAALEHEQKVSASIRDLYIACEQATDLDSKPLLSWFLAEQIEEESTVSEIIGRIKWIDNDGPGLLRLDAELGARPTRSTDNSGESALPV